MSQPQFSFTTKWPVGRVNVLVNQVEIIIPNTNNVLKINAIWDTGATSTAITQNVVDKLGLLPTGMTNVHTANGTALQNTYIVDVRLPNQVQVKDVTVTAAAAFSSGCDALIGMDIIGLGDFSVTNYNGETCMSFRIPSCHEIDYARNQNYRWMQGKQIPAGKPGSNRTPKKKRRK
jgi:predicted aspartyl protease